LTVVFVLPAPSEGMETGIVVFGVAAGRHGVNGTIRGLMLRASTRSPANRIVVVILGGATWLNARGAHESWPFSSCNVREGPVPKPFNTLLAIIALQ
jgi:hypothetical protein